MASSPPAVQQHDQENPLLRVADLTSLAQAGFGRDTPMVVDNTVATGLLQKPLGLGAVASLAR